MAKFIQFRIYFLGISLLAVSLVQAQDVNTLRKAFELGDYTRIIETTNSLSIKNDAEMLLLRGKAYTELGLTQKSLSDLARAKTLGLESTEITLYLAKTYHHEGQYKKAIAWYKTYLSELKRKDRIGREDIFKAISQCNYAQAIAYNPDVIVETPSGDMNSRKDEVRPILSRSSSNTLYYTETTPMTDKIVGSTYINDGWQSNDNLPPSINKKGRNILFDLNGDGHVLFFFSDQDNKVYSLYNKKSKPENNYFFQAPFFPHLGDCDLQVVNSKTIIFASKRPDSRGGYDLYMSEFDSGKWSTPKNLGDNINSIYDERSPFLTSNGEKLYFSTNSDATLGGFDIFESSKSRSKSGWTRPSNLMSPINSAGDDLHFRVDGNGLRAVFSSNRSGTQGGHDIFFAYFNKPVSSEIVDASHLGFIKYSTDGVVKTTQQEDNNFEGQIGGLDEDELLTKPVNVSPSSMKTNKQEKKSISKKNKDDSTIIATLPQSPEAEKDPVVKRKREPKSRLASDDSKNDPEGYLVVDKETEKQKENREKYVPNSEIDISESFDNLTTSEIRIPTMYYATDDDIFSQENKAKLDLLVKQIKALPKSTVVELTNYTHEAARREYELFFAITKMEKLVEYLEDQGIKKERLIVNSVGSSYPMALTMLGGKENQEYIDINQRIEATLYDTPREYSINYDRKEIPNFASSRKYDLYKTVKDDMHYRVEFAETSHVFKNRVLSYYDDIIITRDYKFDKYHYSVGFLQTYEKALELQKKLVLKNLKDTKIQPYLGSRPLTMKQAIAKSGEYPGLRPYINAK